MADCRIPEAFYDEVAAHHLPPDEPIGLQGGRPRTRNRVVLKMIWFVMTTGCRWNDVPSEMDCSVETAHTRLVTWEAVGVWNRLHLDMLRLLRRDGELEQETAIVDAMFVRAQGAGELSGPSPVNRGKPGQKNTFAVNRQGVPETVRVRGANTSDHHELLPLSKEEFPAIPSRVGRPKPKPGAVIADAGYDSESTRNALRCLGIKSLICERGAEHGSGLGKVRWVVEHTIGWVKGLRRLWISYDRSTQALEAFATLAMTVINFRIWFHNLRPLH